jgi:ADP-ribose pyrophosphatase YjhB (NUDIX family)
MEETKYEGRFIRVTEERTGGKVFERAYGKDALILFPFTDDRRILIIEEYRPHEKPAIRWKFVTGFHETGVPLEEMANMELQEEIGRKAGRIQPYLTLDQHGGFIQKRTYLTATRLTDSRLPNPDGADAVRQIDAVPIPELERRILDGTFHTSLASLVYLRLAHDIRRGKVTLD